MQWLDALRPHLLAMPNLAKFAIIIAVIVGVPALARCLRIPELIALLVFGVLLGPHVLCVYGTNHPIVQFFADLGKLMLMFTAGLDIDINLFRRTQPQVNDTCLGFFRDYVAARTDAKAFAMNPEGHCGSEINGRSLDDAKEEAMTRCKSAWKDCKLYAAGQKLVERTN
jgi:hypothetical protein